MSDEMKTYFKPLLNSKLITDYFDIYYLCTIVGMAKLKKGDFRGNEVFYKTVHSNYQDGKYKEMLLTLINAEIKKIGIDINNRNDIRMLCNEILDSDNVNQITQRGADLLNAYCAGGFEEIKNAQLRLSEPYIFVEEYISLLNEEPNVSFCY
jgi:hypothetical protein